MRVLVVGGAGYVGSFVAARLVKAGHGVTVLDNLSTGHRGAVPDGVTWEHGDLEGAELDRLLADIGFDLVVHLAARSLVAESMAAPGLYFTANVGGVVRLLEAMRRSGSPRLLFSSSAAVYGNPESTPVEEDAPLRPTSPYGESKWMIERILRWYGDAHGLEWSALRYFNAAGANDAFGEDHRPETHLIPVALEVALGQRATLTIHGDDYPTPDGTCVRDFVHVLDLAEAHLLAAERLAGGDGGIFNLGAERGASVLEVARVIRAVTGAELPLEVGPRRHGDPPVLVASNNRAKRELGWAPVASDLETIVTSAWEWKRRHPQGYDTGARPGGDRR